MAEERTMDKVSEYLCLPKKKGVYKMDSDEVEAEKALNTLLPDLIEHLDPCLIASFYSKNLITEAERETIEAKETNALKISHLLTILRRKLDNKKVMWALISLLEGEHGEYKETHQVILNKVATAFPPYSYVCSSRYQTQHMPNPELHSYVTNVNNSRHTSETNVIQPNTDIPTVPLNADTSLDKYKQSFQSNVDEMEFEDRNPKQKPTKISRVDVLEDESSQDYHDVAESVDIRETIEDILTKQEENPRKCKHSPTEQQQTVVKTFRNETLEGDSRDDLLGIHNHNDVYQECKHCSANWYIIGLNLGIPQNTLAVITKNNPLDCDLCMSEMLARWLKRVDQKSIPSWRRLCRALCDVDKSTADQIAEKHHVTDYNREKDVSTTNPGGSDQCYIGQMMFQRIGNKEWLAKFMVFKDDSERKKYLETHTNYEEGERIPFHFCDDGCIKLKMIPSEYKGWTLKPEDEETPLIITKKNVDQGGTNELYSACVITVSATSVAKHPLSYEIPLTGTIENIVITIKRTFKGLAPFYEFCGCEECTITRMIRGEKCTNPKKDWYPDLLLLNRGHSLSSQLHRSLSNTSEARSATINLERKYKACYSQTIHRLKHLVNRNHFSKLFNRLTCKTIFNRLINEFTVQNPTCDYRLRLNKFDSLEDYLKIELKISWFNFRPIQKLAEWFLSKPQQADLQNQWNGYIELFQDYCTNRNLKDVVKTLFNSESDSVFVIHVDDAYKDIKVCEIASFRETLEYVFDISVCALHLVAVEGGSVYMFFSYHHEHLNKFQNLSLRQLSMLSRCNILTLKDTQNHFAYENIQKYKILPLEFLYDQDSLLDSWFSKRSIFEALDLEVSEKQLQSLYDTVVSDNDILLSGKATQKILKLQAMLGIIGEDHMKINDDQIMGMEQVDDLHGTTIVTHKTPTVAGVTEFPMDEEHRFEGEYKSKHKPESDQILQALRCTSIFEVVKFFSLYDLCVTEEQKIQLLSLAATSESEFTIEMNPLKVLVSVIHDTESKAKEAELSKEGEEEEYVETLHLASKDKQGGKTHEENKKTMDHLSKVADIYRKMSHDMMWRLHAKEIQIKQLQCMNVECHLELSELMSRSSKPTSDCYTGNLPAPEAEARMIPERDTGQPPHHRISKETNAKKEKIKKLESVKRDHKSEEKNVETFNLKKHTLEAKDELGGEYSEEAEKTLEDFPSCDISELFIFEMCGCGNCSEQDWFEGRFCERPNKDYPHFMMLDPFRDCHTHNKETEIYLETRELEKKFRVYSLSVWQKLICEVKASKNPQRNIEKLITQCRVHLPLPPQISCIAELTHYFNETRVSWFNFEPVQCLAQCLSQDFVCTWEQYSSLFQECCSQRKLKEYSGILLCESSEHVFILEIDESVNQMMVSEIPGLCACLCHTFDCRAVNLHLVKDLKQVNHLALSFCYCFDDYADKFTEFSSFTQVTALENFRAVRLKDRNGAFNHDIQMYMKMHEAGFESQSSQICALKSQISELKKDKSKLEDDKSRLEDEQMEAKHKIEQLHSTVSIMEEKLCKIEGELMHDPYVNKSRQFAKLKQLSKTVELLENEGASLYAEMDELLNKASEMKAHEKDSEKIFKNTISQLQNLYRVVPTYEKEVKFHQRKGKEEFAKCTTKEEMALVQKEIEKCALESEKLSVKKTIGQQETGLTGITEKLHDDKQLMYDEDTYGGSLKNMKRGDESLVESIRKCEIRDTSVSWNDIVGLENAKRCLQEIVDLPALRPDGVLLFGPPGNGETLLAEAVARESKSTFFNISGARLLSKSAGESKMNVKALFDEARECQPSVIFIDEVDALVSRVEKNVMTEFLTQFDRMTTSESEILVMGATNRPEDIDEAALRTFTKKIYIPLPDSDARTLTLQKLLKDSKHEIDNAKILTIVSKTEHYSFSDLTALAQEAARGPIRELLPTMNADQIRPIQYRDFVRSLSQIRPSVKNETIKKLEEWNQK